MSRDLNAMALMLLFVAAGCGAKHDTGAASAPAKTTQEGELRATQLGQVWIFEYEASGDSYDAVHRGTARIVDDCLMIGEALVVWREGSEDEVRTVVERALQGELLEVTVAGGGLSAREGDELPESILSRCEADLIWYAAGGMDVEAGAK